MSDVRILILIGNPGAGKTWVGETLARRAGLVFLDLERMFLERYGSTERFLADKAAALEWFEEQARKRAATGDRTVVFEVGAFSQRDTVRRLQDEFTTALILVEAPADVRRRRIEERDRGRHLTDEADLSMKHDDLFERELKPMFDFTLEVRNDSLSEEQLVLRVREGLGRAGLRWIEEEAR